MGAIADAARGGDIDALVGLIDRRMAGDHLDAPFGVGGIAPRDLIVELYRQPEAVPVIDRAIATLLSTKALACVEAVDADDGRGEALLWALEFFALLRDLRFSGAHRDFRRACERVCLLDIERPAARQLQLACLTAYATGGSDAKGLIDYFSRALRSADAARSFSCALAGTAPGVFLTALGPHLLTELADWSDAGPQDLTFLTDALRNALDALAADHLDPIQHGLDKFLRHAADKACHPGGANIRAAVSTALSLSPLSISILREFEHAYWGMCPKTDIRRDAKLHDAREYLRKQARSGFPVTKTLRSVITINSLPYAEAALLRLFEHVMKAAFDVDVLTHSTEYGNVLEDLLKGRIDIAVHNGTLIEQQHSIPENTPILASSPLIIFKKYDVLANRARLRELVRSPELSEKARGLAQQILSGDRIAPAAPGLNELAQHGEVTFLDGTDTERIAGLFFGPSLRHHRHDLDPDEGLERLLDGGVCFYVGGALQSHYAQNTCRNRVLIAGEVNTDTNVRFYLLDEKFRQDEELYRVCLRAWGAVVDIWEDLRNPGKASSILKPLLDALRTDLVAHINSDRSLRYGLASSFDDLRQVISDHDILKKGHQKPYFFPVDSVTAEERREEDNVLFTDFSEKGKIQR